MPSDDEMMRLTMREFLHSPEKFIRLGIRTTRDLATATRSGGLKALADMMAQPIPAPSARRCGNGSAPTTATTWTTPSLPPTQAPRTPFNRPISPHRRFAYTSVALDDAKKVRRAFGCTFNDVVMTVCSGTLRRYLERHDCLPDESLIAMVPVSVRTGGEDDTYQNRVSALLADLATNEADPIARLRRVQQSMTAAKENFAAIPADTLQDYTQFAPPAIAARAMRMYSRLRIADRMNPPFNLVISNVPGPAQPLYSAGAQLQHFYPVSTIIDGQGLNMTVQSYNGNLDFGFVACRELVPDLWDMVDMLHDAMAELVQLADAALAPLQPPAESAPRRAKAAAPVKKAAAKKAAAPARGRAGQEAGSGEEGRCAHEEGGYEAGSGTR